MRQLFLDGASWKSVDDLYSSFFEVVQAPSWHGRNLNAVSDSIGTGGINGIEVPYCLVIKNGRLIPQHMEQSVSAFVDVVRQLAKEGVPVDVRFEE